MLLEKVQRSFTLDILNQVLQLKSKGEKVTSLAVGDPSFTTPRDIVESAYRSMLDGDVHYVPSRGTVEVREAIVRKVSRKNGIRASSENTIFMAAKMSVFAALAAVSQPSSSFEVLVPNPGYFYSEPVVLAGGRPIYYRLTDQFRPDPDEISRKITSKTRAIIINTPSNPTGTVFSRRQLREVYDTCHKRNVTMISDEAYEDLIYGSAEHVSLGSFEKEPERVISIYTLSKSYAMTGWRAGYIVGPKKHVDLIGTFVEHAVTCFPPFIQHASAFALENGDEHIKEFRRAYLARKELVEQKIAEIPGLSATPIEGAFYAFPRYELGGGGRGKKAASMSSREFCERLLKSQKVAVLPGAAFGSLGENHVRVSFAPDEETIEAGMNGLKKFMSGKS